MKEVDYSTIPYDDNERNAFKFRERRHQEWTDNYELYRNKVIINRLTQRQAVNIPLMKETLKTILANTDEFPAIEYEELGNDKDKEILFNEVWKDYVIQEAEDVDELVLDRGGFGEHAVGSGPAALALVEQHGLADPGGLADQLAHGQVQRRTLVPGAGD